MSREFRISLRSFIFLLLSLCVSVPVLLYGYSRSLRLESEVLAQVDLSNKIATERNADHIETLISSRIEVTQALAGTLATMDAWSPTQLQQLAKATVESVDAVQYITIADASGISKVFYPSRAPGHLAGVSYNDRAYIQRLRATNEPVVSKVIIGRSSKVAQIAIAAPIMTSTGEFRGFVTATVPIATLVEEIMDTTDTALQQRIIVLDAASQVLADTNDVQLASLLSLADARFLTATDPAHASTVSAPHSPDAPAPSEPSAEPDPEAATETPAPHDSAPGSPEAAAPATPAVPQAPAGSAPAPSSHRSMHASAQSAPDHPAGPPLALSQAADARCTGTAARVPAGSAPQ